MQKTLKAVYDFFKKNSRKRVCYATCMELRKTGIDIKETTLIKNGQLRSYVIIKQGDKMVNIYYRGKAHFMRSLNGKIK